MHRVVVTGAGVVSSIGQNMAEMASALKDGKSGIGPLDFIDADKLTQSIGGQVAFEAADHFDSRELGMLDRVSQFALVSAREAIAQSGIEFGNELALETAVIIGSGIGGQSTQEDGYRRIFLDEKRPHPFTVPRMMPNAPASQISMTHGLKGPAYTISSACASATHALGQAFMMVRSGMARAAISGGTEAILQYGSLRAWEALRVMANDACRPFSIGRKGMVLGEGGGSFVLERLEDAKARGANILCEIVGHGMGADAGDLTAPDVDGMARAMAATLKDGGLNAEDISYINAHGTGTMANDTAESAAIHKVFGDYGASVPVSSTKAMHGHALGGAGAIEFAALLAAMQGDFIPPTINFTEADPDCPIDCVPNTARDGKITAALSNSFAFGGLNAVLAVRKI